MVPKFAAIPSFSEIIAQIGEALWVVSPTGQWIYVNPTFSRFIGIRDEDVYSHQLFEYIHPDDKNECAQVFEQLKAGADIADVRYRLIHSEGMDVWVTSVVTAVRDTSRHIQYFVGTSRKVSAEKTEPAKGGSETSKEQAALPKGPEIPYESVIELMPNPVWVVDTARNFIFTNPAFNILVGYSGNELVGKGLADISNPGKVEELDASVKQLIEGEELAEVDISLRHRNGKDIPVRFLIKPVRSQEGGIKLFIGSSRVQGKHLPGSALPDPAEPYKDALECIGVPAWLSDVKGNWVHVNSAFSFLVGLKHGEIPSGNLPGIVHPDDQGLIKSALSDLRKTDSVKLSCRIQPRADKLFWMDITLSAVKADDGKLAYILATARDLTNEHNLETKIAHLNSRLQDVIDQMDDATLATDRDGKIRMINTRIPDLLDRMDFEILEQGIADIFPPGYANNVGNAMKAASSGNSGDVTVEVERAEGSVPLAFKYVPLRHEGVVDGVLIVLRKLG